MGWVNEIMEATIESESPRSYYYWSSIAALSAVVRNRVYLDKWFYRLYPNIFVMLIGKSGLRKGPPVNLAKDLVSMVPVCRVIAGRNSIQAILQDLSRSKTQPDGTIIKDATAFLVSGEFANFIIQDPQSLTILTDLYDSHFNAEWKNTLKASGVETLKKVCLTMLGASSPVHFRQAVPENAIGGGFIGRTLIVYETKKSRVNSLMKEPELKLNREKLGEYLHEVSKLEGPFKITPGARSIYEAWYQNFCDTSDNNGDDGTGTNERMHDQVLKVAMMLAVSNKLELVINEEEMTEAIDECTKLSLGTRRAVMGKGQSQLAEPLAKVIEVLLNSFPKAMMRAHLLRKCWGDVDAASLNLITETLIDTQSLDLKEYKKGLYKLTQETYDSFIEMGKRNDRIREDAQDG